MWPKLANEKFSTMWLRVANEKVPSLLRINPLGQEFNVLIVDCFLSKTRFKVRFPTHTEEQRALIVQPSFGTFHFEKAAGKRDFPY